MMFCSAIANAMGMKILQKQEGSGEFAVELCTFALLYLLLDLFCPGDATPASARWAVDCGAACVGISATIC